MVDLSSATIQRIASLQLDFGKDVKSLGVFVVHMSKCVCLHMSVGLDVDVRVHVWLRGEGPKAVTTISDILIIRLASSQ